MVGIAAGSAQAGIITAVLATMPLANVHVRENWRELMSDGRDISEPAEVIALVLKRPHMYHMLTCALPTTTRTTHKVLGRTECEATRG